MILPKMRKTGLMNKECLLLDLALFKVLSSLFGKFVKINMYSHIRIS